MDYNLVCLRLKSKWNKVIKIKTTTKKNHWIITKFRNKKQLISILTKLDINLEIKRLLISNVIFIINKIL